MAYSEIAPPPSPLKCYAIYERSISIRLSFDMRKDTLRGQGSRKHGYYENILIVLGITSTVDLAEYPRGNRCRIYFQKIPRRFHTHAERWIACFARIDS